MKNKKFNRESVIAYDYNSQFSAYIKFKESKKGLNFFTFFTEKGLVLIESDNETFYKVTHFE